VPVAGMISRPGNAPGVPPKLKPVLELQHSDSFRPNPPKTPKNEALATGFNLPVVPGIF